MSFFQVYPVRLVGYSVLALLLGYALKGDELRSFFINSHQPLELNTPSSADVLIIGGSHAGLSAALTLTRHQIDVLILDSNAPRNKWKTPTHALPTWENRNPDDLRRASWKELQKTGFASFANTHITTITKTGANESMFIARDSLGREWSGRKLLIAAGVEFVFPLIKGYEENFPDRILHCLFTRGLEYKGSRSAGLLAMGLAGSPHHSAMLVEDAQKFASTVTVYTNGNLQLGVEITAALLARGEENTAVDNRKIIQLLREPAGDSITIVFDDGGTATESFLVHQPDTRVNLEIVSQLGLETNERNDIVTRMPFYQTNVAGVFAAGDCASPFKMIPNAIFQGSNAGAGIARELPRTITHNHIDRLADKGTTWYSQLQRQFTL
ncbi:hypothetical protein NPX13_g3510 [Xylaria arbuscula]|uniref:FAD/NAD(P)-binding domain-containing protein n=1 Tax=Xylaria arbuscula TaxID=114810 RepID=A0A9W8TN60_9PEZI|nr:hypothetical protein NPX13_g3510 [Xylaria arbuscula]